MIKCIIHCSDIHVRNFQRLDEYTEQLANFVGKCKKIASHYEKEEVRILIAGDLVHQKNSISNELLIFCSHFIRQLEEIAKVIVLAGNHDLIVKNTQRVDTLTALFQTAKFHNSIFVDAELDYESGCIVDDNVIWAVYSIYDDYQIPDIENYISEDKTIIGLYHGMVVGASLNNGCILDTGVNGKIFDKCHCVMAGDIHKRQIIKYGDTIVAYPGSMIQQTFGETISQHGFIVWNLPALSYEFIDLNTDYGLFDIEINSLDDIDNDKERLINF